MTIIVEESRKNAFDKHTTMPFSNLVDEFNEAAGEGELVAYEENAKLFYVKGSKLIEQTPVITYKNTVSNTEVNFFYIDSSKFFIFNKCNEYNVSSLGFNFKGNPSKIKRFLVNGKISQAKINSAAWKIAKQLAGGSKGSKKFFGEAMRKVWSELKNG